MAILVTKGKYIFKDVDGSNPVPWSSLRREVKAAHLSWPDSEPVVLHFPYIAWGHSAQENKPICSIEER